MSTAVGKVINFRAPAARQALIDHAVEVSSVNRTEFILDVVCERREKCWLTRPGSPESTGSAVFQCVTRCAAGEQRGDPPTVEYASALGALSLAAPCAQPAHE